MPCVEGGSSWQQEGAEPWLGCPEHPQGWAGQGEGSWEKSGGVELGER